MLERSDSQACTDGFNVQLLSEPQGVVFVAGAQQSIERLV